jgi:6-pyruvoyl-tetrahydropterin synthase
MYRVAKSIDVDFAHHIAGHDGACINIHGHTWKFWCQLESSGLDEYGFVADFKNLKTKVLKPVHDLLDHSLAIGDELYEQVHTDLSVIGHAMLKTRKQIKGSHYVPMPDFSDRELCGARLHEKANIRVVTFPFPPTSERIARWFHKLACEQMQHGHVRVHSVRVYETLHPVGSYAEYEED